MYLVVALQLRKNKEKKPMDPSAELLGKSSMEHKGTYICIQPFKTTYAGPDEIQD